MHLRPPFGKGSERIVTSWSSQVNKSNKQKSKNPNSSKVTLPNLSSSSLLARVLYKMWSSLFKEHKPYSHWPPNPTASITYAPSPSSPQALKAQCLKGRPCIHACIDTFIYTTQLHFSNIKYGQMYVFACANANGGLLHNDYIHLSRAKLNTCPSLRGGV